MKTVVRESGSFELARLKKKKTFVLWKPGTRLDDTDDTQIGINNSQEIFTLIANILSTQTEEQTWVSMGTRLLIIHTCSSLRCSSPY